MTDELLIETEPTQRLARFRLKDKAGKQIGFNEVQLQARDQAMWEGVFDTRRYVDRYQGNLRPDAHLPPQTADDILRRLGVFLGQTVLGEAIFKQLTRSNLRRTLVIRLPETTADVLAAAFARVPWEIARLTDNSPTLLESNLVVRMVTDDIAQPDEMALEAAAKIADGETLRVLLVFAETPSSRPLAMRLERERLLKLFYRRILDKHPVQIDVLCHGVTQSVLREQIQSARGYHIVHWSGHGHHNLLELRGEAGKPDFITGQELAQLFIEAGGFIPHLVVLSACLSGTLVNIGDWASLLAQLGDAPPDAKQTTPRELNDILRNPPGYTGTALSLWYAALFKTLSQNREQTAQHAAREGGRRALLYLLRASAFDRLGTFAGQLITDTSNPTFLAPIIAEMKAIVDTVPTGETRWKVQNYLADALNRSDQRNASMELYEAATTGAEVAEAWADVATITNNWANALRNVGQLNEAQEMYRRSLSTNRKAGGSRVNIIMYELEMLRIDVYRGKIEKALPQIKERLDLIRGWWARNERGESVSEAPDREFLGRSILGALDIAGQANYALARWTAYLALLEESEQVARAQGASEYEQAKQRFNQYVVLIELGRLDAAQAVVEECLCIFQHTEDVHSQAAALGALASVWDKRENTQKAVALARQALSLINCLPDPRTRAILHGNLAVYMERFGEAEVRVSHRLAALIYNLISGHQTELSRELSNIGVRIRQATAAGKTYALPRLNAVLAQPEFDPLRQFIAQRGFSNNELQAAIDRLIEGVRNAVNSR